MNVVQELGRRARHRLERHGVLLRAAMRIAFAEGLGSLTMQRVAADVDCAVGTVYTYFPSKSALVAELQREAIEVLDASCARFEARFDEHATKRERDPGVRSLALITGYAQFWVDTFETFPEEARLMQLLMSDTSQSVDDQDVSRVLPVAFRLLDRMRGALDVAAEHDALEPGDALERSVVLAASLNGVLLLDHVARVDPELFDGRRLARSLVGDLLRGWGAEPTAVATAARRITKLARQGPLAERDTASTDTATTGADTDNTTGARTDSTGEGK